MIKIFLSGSTILAVSTDAHILLVWVSRDEKCKWTNFSYEIIREVTIRIRLRLFRDFGRGSGCFYQIRTFFFLSGSTILAVSTDAHILLVWVSRDDKCRCNNYPSIFGKYGCQPEVRARHFFCTEGKEGKVDGGSWLYNRWIFRDPFFVSFLSINLKV